MTRPDGDVLGLGPTWPRPGWAVLDAAREQAFTGIVEFQTTPILRVCFDRGRTYLAERVTDPPLGARLVDAGALTATELERGTIRVGGVEHLGRLFERSPSVDRHTVLVLLELMSDEATTWVASQTVRGAVVLPYEMHASGVHRWERDRDRTVVVLEGTPAALPPPVAGTAVLMAPDAVGDVEELTDEVRIEWAEESWMGSERAGRTAAVGGSLLAPVVEAPVEAPAERSTPGLAVDPSDADSAAVAFAAVDDVVDGFEVIWPTGEVQRELTATLDPVAAARVDAPPPPPQGLTWNLRMPAPALALGDESDADLVDELAEEVAQAVRRAIAAITAGEPAAVQVPAPPPAPPVAEGPIIVRSSTLTPAETEAAPFVRSGNPPGRTLLVGPHPSPKPLAGGQARRPVVSGGRRRTT